MTDALVLEKKKRIPKPPDFAPEQVWPAGHPKAGQARCTAWNGNAGRQCTSFPIRSTTKCYVHGGMSLRGSASATFTTGRYSKSLPARLLATYEAGLKDQELVSLRKEMALLDARTEELLGKIDIADSGRAWKQLQSRMGDFDRLNRRASRLPEDNPNRGVYLTEAADALNEVRSIIDKGLGEWAIWTEIKDNWALRRSLAESERRRLVDMQQMINAEQGKSLAQALAKAVVNNVTDTRILSRIDAEFAAILSAGHPANTIPEAE